MYVEMLFQLAVLPQTANNKMSWSEGTAYAATEARQEYKCGFLK